MQKIKSLFRDTRQAKLFFLMCLSTLFCFALIGVRLQQTNFDYTQIQSTDDLIRLRGTTSFFFLVWNLFLAWVPYWIALALENTQKHFNSKILTGVMLFSWLLFFPNAPYIITDLLHLQNRFPVPHWFDLMLIISFAWTGLILGLLSLYEVQLFLKKSMSSTWTWIITITAIFLGGFGVYLGRFLRWNSWDILSNPLQLFNDMIQSVFHPDAIGGTLGVTCILSGFLLIGYLTLTTLIDNSETK